MLPGGIGPHDPKPHMLLLRAGSPSTSPYDDARAHSARADQVAAPPSPARAVAAVAADPTLLGTTRDSGDEPATGRVRRFRFGPTQQEPTSGSRFNRVCPGGSSTALLLGRQRSHAVGADCRFEDDRYRNGLGPGWAGPGRRRHRVLLIDAWWGHRFAVAGFRGDR